MSSKYSVHQKSNQMQQVKDNEKLKKLLYYGGYDKLPNNRMSEICNVTERRMIWN